jgi:hypothetical protein
MNALLHLPLVELPAVYAVVGEHRHDPAWLLLLGSDGRHYAYHALDGAVHPVALDEDWRLDGPERPVREELAQLVG